MLVLKTTLALFACVVTLATAADKPPVKRFTTYTRPMELSQGEVSNSYHTLQIPKGPIAVYRVEADIVEHDKDGNVVPVPTFDAYLHHHAVGSKHNAYAVMAERWAPMKPESFSRSVGFGAGTECRGTPQEFYHPYAFVTVEGEDEWIANVHIINTRKMPLEKTRRCLECPCKSDDEFTENAVNGLPFLEMDCNAELRAENNTVCAAATYHGGLRCCEDASLCLEKSEVEPKSAGTSTYYLRYTLEYAEVAPDVRPLFLSGCCDASGDFDNHGNVEYDIPACDPELHPGCVHTLATRQRLDLGTNAVSTLLQTDGYDTADHEVEIVFAVGHQHRSGLGISIYNDATGDLICSSTPKYGKGDTVGDEKDYVVAMSTCTFNPPLRMKASDVIRVVALYNNTLPHTGAMSLMYLAVSALNSNAVETIEAAKKQSDAEIERAGVAADASASGWTTSLTVMVGVAMAGMVLAVAGVIHKKKRSGYTPLPVPQA